MTASNPPANSIQSHVTDYPGCLLAEGMSSNERSEQVKAACSEIAKQLCCVPRDNAGDSMSCTAVNLGASLLGILCVMVIIAALVYYLMKLRNEKRKSDVAANSSAPQIFRLRNLVGEK